MDTSFTVVDASWPLARIKRALRDARTSHLIFRESGPGGDAYHLFNQITARFVVGQVIDPSWDRETMFDVLFSRGAARNVDIDDAGDVQDACVVLDRGVVVGFRDPAPYDFIDWGRGGDADMAVGGKPAAEEAVETTFGAPPEVAEAANGHEVMANGGGGGMRGGDVGAPPEPLVGAGADGAPPLVRRTMQAELPDRVELGATVTLMVSLVREAKAGVAAAPLNRALPPGTELMVYITPKNKLLVLESPPNGKLIVPADNDEFDPACPFELKAVGLGEAELIVRVFLRTETLAQVKVKTLVVGQGAATGAATRALAAAVSAPSGFPQPDITLLIDEQTEADGRLVLDVKLSVLNPSYGINFLSGTANIDIKPAEYFKTFFKDIESLPRTTTAERLEAEGKLKQKGLDLFTKVVPEKLQAALWTLRDANLSMHVQSDEPWIPWEMCVLQVIDDKGKADEGGFFAEAFTITRWVSEVGRKFQLRLNNVALVVPTDSTLTAAPAESEFVLSLAGAGRKVTSVPANFLSLKAQFEAGTFDAWHFCGHGVSDSGTPDGLKIKLEGGSGFKCNDLTGKVQRLGDARPVVFFNACEVSQGVLSLTSMGGFAQRFVECGASAFIGTYWSITDSLALLFAKKFYEQLLVEGQTIGEAARQARLSIKGTGDPTWMAYTVFAEPLARVVP